MNGLFSPQEKIVTSALYRGVKIHCTNMNRIIVEFPLSAYPVGNLEAAKDMIDKSINDSRN